MYQTQKEVAKAFDVSITTVQNWANDDDFPGGRRGPWSHSQIELYRAANGKGGSGSGGGGGGATDEETAKLQRVMLHAKAKKLSEEVRKLKLINDKAEGRVVDRLEAKIEVSEIFGRQRDRFLLLPQAIANEVPSEFKAEVMRAAQRQVDLLLGEMQGWGEQLFGDE